MVLAGPAAADSTRPAMAEMIRKPHHQPTAAEAAGINTLAWKLRAIVLSVDGLRLNEVELTRTVNQDGTGRNPFHERHYLLLNLAIGGTAGGDPSTTTFPARFEVDFVRVYKRK